MTCIHSLAKHQYSIVYIKLKEECTLLPQGVAKIGINCNNKENKVDSIGFQKDTQGTIFSSKSHLIVVCDRGASKNIFDINKKLRLR